MVAYLFVDGGYLRRVLEVFSKKLFGGALMQLDFRKLLGSHTKGFYYDCMPAQRRDEADDDYELRVAPQKALFDEIRLVDGFRVFEGTIRGVPGKARQKQIDVKIAVDMLAHSYRRNMNKATLLSGDLDFKPAIDAMVQDGTYVTLWSEKSSTCKQLAFAADARWTLTVDYVHGLCKDDFREKHPIPQLLCGTMLEQPENLPIVKKGTLPDGSPAKLFSDGKRHVIVFADKQHRQRYIHAECYELDMLHKFVDHMFGDITWV